MSDQKVNYQIFIVEPVGNITFNRALLFNIGFVESQRAEHNMNFKWDCFIFHDVDMLPENKKNFYKCNSKFPMHFAVACNTWNYRYLKKLKLFNTVNTRDVKNYKKC